MNTTENSHPAYLGLLNTELLREETLVEIFELTAAAHPHRPAVELTGEIVTYAQLSSRVNQLCALLAAKGIGKGARVALLMPRSIDACTAMLAVMKVGAAYVPIDTGYPDDRCAFIIGDCNAAMVLTTASLLSRASTFGTTSLALDGTNVNSKNNENSKNNDNGKNIDGKPTSASPDDIAYIIYTSGTTGRPKGVPISHRSVCHLVRAEGDLFAVTCKDRIYHGFSISFDASIEELWLAWFAGASLVIAPEDIARSGPDLSQWLAQQNVTVLSCVPTLLSLFEGDIPSLHLLILGGEVCPQALVARWAKAGRRIANTYGPTEATVIATYAWCEPDKPVTIGRPVPNYVAYILDEQQHQVAQGEPGELCLGGPGLAAGYLNREALTQEKFITNPYKDDPGAPSRLYRTGDCVRATTQGELEFAGRVDDQVKIRGYRIELGEIETALQALPNVRQAAVAVHEDSSGLAQLVGYLVLDNNATINDSQCRALLRIKLPTFMVPAYLETIAVLPTLVSGKLDRRALPAPRTVLPAAASEPGEEGQSDTERRVLKVWRTLFAPQAVGRSDNFFDLGGHSLLAARMISELRSDAALASASVVDVYRHPVLTEFALAIQKTPEVAPQSAVAKSVPPPISQFGRWCCWAGQIVGLYCVFAIYSAQWFVPWFVFDYFEDAPHRAMYAGLLAMSVAFVFQPLQMLVCVAVKWIVIGRFREGDYPLWSLYYWRFWLVRTIYKLFSLSNLQGTPFMPLFCRLMGASVGSNVYIASELEGSALIEIGEGTSLNADAQLRFFKVEEGILKLRHIRIGRHCEIGQSSIVEGGAVMEDNSRLGPLSLLPEGVTIAQGEYWEGSPAKRVSTNIDSSPVLNVDARSKMFSSVMYVVGFFGLAIFPLPPAVPGMLLLAWVDNNFEWYWSLAAAPVLVGSYMVIIALQIAAAKWLLLGRVKPGSYKLHSGFYIRHWFVDRLLHMSLEVLFPAYATLYLAPWLRLLGAKLGRGAEVSTMMHFTPDLIDLGENVFVADATSVGAPRVHGGWLELEAVKIGPASFIGNGAVVAGGTELGEKSLIGCLSLPPTSVNDRSRLDASWMGSPAVYLPNRVVNTQFSHEVTYSPSRKMYILRGSIELLRMMLPGTVVVAASTLLMNMASLVGEHLAWPEFILVFPFFTLTLGLIVAAFTIMMKWIVIGRYREGEFPLWSTFVWRSELVTALHDYIASPMLLSAFKGTPFIAWYLRLLGAKVGSGVYFDSTFVTEFDLIEIGSRCCIDTDCDLQTHLFEDRVMKTSYVRLGDDCTVGTMSVVLYDTKIGDGVTLAPLSLVLKGETLPPGGRWMGAPVQAMSAQARGSAGGT